MTTPPLNRRTPPLNVPALLAERRRVTRQRDACDVALVVLGIALLALLALLVSGGIN